MPKVKQIKTGRMICWFCHKTFDSEELKDGYYPCPECGHVTFQSIAPPPVDENE